MAPGWSATNLTDPMMQSTRIFIVAALVASACVQPTTNGMERSQEGDWAAILALEDQAKVIAKTPGCSTVSQCRTAPVGNRACGGPRYYIAYCSTSTDSVALFRKLAEVAAAEDAFNRKYQIGSTCEYRMPGEITLSGGECRTASR